MRFQQALKSHGCVADAARSDAVLAASIWHALVDRTAPAGSYAEAMIDTMPVEHAPLVASSNHAAAYAFARAWEAKPYRPGLSSFELRDAARGAWEEFEKRAGSAAELARGFGWDLSEAWTVVEDVTVQNGNLGEVTRIAKMAGRMYAALRGARARKIAGIPEEVYDVEQGNNLSRLLPSELAAIADSELELPALARFVERRSLQYALRGTSKRGKGPMVLALDESASMHAQRREWSKASAIALMRVAFDEKRPVAVVHYSTSCFVRHVKPGDAQAVLEMIRHWYDGGTRIGLALSCAVEAVEAMAQKGDSGADIVLMTDGEDGNVAAQLDALDAAAKASARLWTVAIECQIPSTSPLRERAAEYIEVGAAEMAAGSALALGKAAA